MEPNDVIRWLDGLGSLLPKEAVAALAKEVRRQQMDGAQFSRLVASRATPMMDDAVKPSHMATLRRCWKSSGGYVEDITRSPGETTMLSPVSTSSFQSLEPSLKQPSWAASRTETRLPLTSAEQSPQQPRTRQQPVQQQGVGYFAAGRAGDPPRPLYGAPGARSSDVLERDRLGTSGYVTSPELAVRNRHAVPSPPVEFSTLPERQYPPSLPVASRRQFQKSQQPASLFAAESNGDARGFNAKSSDNDLNRRKLFAPPSRARSALHLGVNGASRDAHAGGAYNRVGAGARPGVGLSFNLVAEEQNISNASTPRDDGLDGLVDSCGEDVFSVGELPRPLGGSHRRPLQVPRLNLGFIHGGTGQSEDALTKHKWGQPRAPATTTYASERRCGDNASRKGFAWASSEDQQRIAEFYGYRDEGFIATMQGLQTDMIRPRLYVGNMADATYLPLLEDLGITDIVNCAIEAQKGKPPYDTQGIKYHLVPLQDSVGQTETLTKQRFRSIRVATKLINQALKGSSKGSVLVHCVQGLSRSAALVCAYLMEYEGLAMERAIAEVKSKHPGCLTADHWQTFLYRFKAELLRGH
eukprot:TRINITY_DN5195_c0_g3_i1.p1 TRINITY_DN5195_c0_g3~~TRINITY_DN5195_c0_g3_i1.p1  ORF type:complete len:605 (+),score=94.54 TRINITY_DN5195_c0_g3_i1:67-1815(+)